MVLKDREEIDLFEKAAREEGFTNISSFTDSHEAYEVVIRKQYDMFIVRMETTPVSGIVFIQKMRATGNYGHEIQVFVADKIPDTMVATLHDLDVNHVLMEPIIDDTVRNKLQAVTKLESSLSGADQVYRNARTALQSGLHDMAEHYGRELTKFEPDSIRCNIFLGDIAACKGNQATARQWYDNALAIDTDSAVATDKKAQTYMAEGDYKTAAALLDKLPELNPYNVNILEHAGVSNYHVGNLERAQALLRSLSELDDRNKSASGTLAKIAADRGDFEQMAKLAAKNHEGKELVVLLNNKGAQIGETSPETALKLFEASLSVLSNNPYAYALYFNLALAYKKLQRTSDAADACNLALKLKPDFAQAKRLAEKLKT